MATHTERGTAQVYLHWFSYRFRLRNDPDFTLYSMIDDVRGRGLDGINVSSFPPFYDDLSGAGRVQLDRCAAALREAGLGVDIETNTTSPEVLQHVLQVGQRLGAQLVRTYTRIDPAGPEASMRRAVTDLKAIAPQIADAGMTLVLENHEDLVCRETAEVVAEVDSPAVRALFDYGNDMAVSQPPLASLDDVLAVVASAHLKDQIVVRPGGGQSPVLLGVPLGAGVIPVRELTERLVMAGVPRICLEPTWGYQCGIQPPRGAAGAGLGPLFQPVDVDLDDPRFCLNADALLQSDPEWVCREEARMLELSCAWVATGLAGLPLTLPRPVDTGSAAGT